MATPSQLLGVVLAGGLSRRMDGQEKSLLELAGSPLITHAIKRLQKQCPNVVINANGETERFSFTGLPVFADTLDGFAGPLAGVLAGMEWAVKQQPDCTHIITAATDTPFFPADYVTQMLEAIGDKESCIALASSNNRRHPVFGLWPIALKKPLRDFLVDEGNRKVMLFVERYPFETVEFKAGNYDPFFNVNTPEDLSMAKSLLEKIR